MQFTMFPKKVVGNSTKWYNLYQKKMTFLLFIRHLKEHHPAVLDKIKNNELFVVVAQPGPTNQNYFCLVSENEL